MNTISISLLIFYQGQSLSAQAITAAKQSLTATLDLYYNNEYRKDKQGNVSRWHYTWEETDYGGYSDWAACFHKAGVLTDTLSVAPTAALLKHTDIYIIADPDTEKETAQPHFMNDKEAAVIYNWVKKGGVLVIMQNDSANAEHKNFNRLTERFGIHFNEDSHNRVQGKQYEQGAFLLPPDHEIFKGIQKVYIKEIASQQLTPPARAVYEKDGHVFMSVSKVGKGTVFAVGDPWFYNEYTDGKRLSSDYENYAAAQALVYWLVAQTRHPSAKKI
ncbi:hypothetical protein KTO58_07340 [Chitinophaga pendula]|uniref:DUF4350 domain-containing protein n=1 Tax=Chitinophaga TaxID=79328 RepID=UPI0012FDB5EB|nr:MULTISPECIES: hypothetical protein [Chitinophaga]UCJ08987.1 hypothetical protein KTO58_07340 [Chitinophaga pendula]